MLVKDFKCPNCGANIKLDQDRDQQYCEYCGSLVWQKDKIVEEHVTRDEAELKKD